MSPRRRVQREPLSDDALKALGTVILNVFQDRNVHPTDGVIVLVDLLAISLSMVSTRDRYRAAVRIMQILLMEESISPPVDNDGNLDFTGDMGIDL